MSTLALIFSAAILFSFVSAILVHEIGHLLAACWYNVHISRFSIGLGPELIGFTNKNGLRWSLAALPFGGFVEMDNDQSSAPFTANMLSTKPLNQRAAICAAGPASNLLFAATIYGCSLAIFGDVALTPTLSQTPAVVVMSLVGGFSLSIAVFNLIPVPPLDGGWLVLLGIQALMKKPMPTQNQKILCSIGKWVIYAATIISTLALATQFVIAL